MKIAYLTSIYARASDTFIRSEVIELRARGHEVHTFSIRRAIEDQHVSAEVASEQRSTDYILARGAPTLVLAFVRQALRRPGPWLAMMRLAWHTRAPGPKALLLQAVYAAEAAYLAERLEQLGIEVLHNHIAENSATVAMLASALGGVPYSMTVHGPGIFYHPLRWALPEKVARSAFTACISSFCRSQCMVFTPPVHWARLQIVRCAVGRSFVGVEPAPIPAAPRLVCIGRLCAEKGMLLLVEAVARHIDAGGRCELVLVGDGPLRGDIERTVRGRGLQGAVRITGWKSSDEVRAELEAARAMVLPSFAEGLPVVIMEALALGRPVLATSIAGIPELVEHGVNGWLVPAGSVDALVEAIGWLTASPPDALAEMGRRGAAKVARLHNLQHEIDSLEGHLRRAVGARARASP